ncbi:MAG: hypothetical protein ACJ8H8_23000 [Geminicoccaceae bacterium]
MDVPEPFERCMGFNADEEGRVERDTTCGGRMRRARYPLLEWGWNREACLDYLRQKLRVEWKKSCCHVCPFTNGNPETLARFRKFPGRAADALLIEHVCLALNPKGSLYRDGKTLRSVIESDKNAAALAAFNERLRACEWAVYHVKRIYRRKGNAGRSVAKIATGDYAAMLTRLALEGSHRGGPGVEVVQGCYRVTLRTPEPDVYPALDEFLVLAPATAADKTSRAGFDNAFSELVGQEKQGSCGVRWC